MALDKQVFHAEFLEFTKQYYKNPGQLRFGQAFINKYYPTTGESSAHIFYADDTAAYKMICNECIIF